MDKESEGAVSRAEFAAPLAELVVALSNLERRLALGLTVALSEENTSFDQWRVMEALSRLDAPTMGELADDTAIPNASLSRIVDSLEDGASAFRLPSATDRRRITVHLSDRGLDRLDRIRAIVGSWEHATEQRISADSIAALRAAAAAAAQALDAPALS